MASATHGPVPIYQSSVAPPAPYSAPISSLHDHHIEQHSQMPCPISYAQSASDEEEDFIVQSQGERIPTTAEEEQMLDEELIWATRTPTGNARTAPRLPLPVLIPQIEPGLQPPFSRAWADSLRAHDVNVEEFLQFIDHLNVCKEASPPLKAVGVAAEITGFVPNHIALIVSAATQVAVGGATYAVARTRIVRYLQRANEQYFEARGLRVRIAKERDLAHITQRPEDAPVLIPMEPSVSSVAIHAAIRDRRLQALQGYIAPLQLDGLPPRSQEQTSLDRLSAKMVEKKSAKTHKKMVKDRIKYSEDNAKEKTKLDKETGKLEKEMTKVQRKASREIGKKPKDTAKIEKDLAKEERKIEKDLLKAQREFEKKTGESGQKEEKKAKKFMWIVVEDLESVKENSAKDARFEALR